MLGNVLEQSPDDQDGDANEWDAFGEVNEHDIHKVRASEGTCTGTATGILASTCLFGFQTCTRTGSGILASICFFAPVRFSNQTCTHPQWSRWFPRAGICFNPLDDQEGDENDWDEFGDVSEHDIDEVRASEATCTGTATGILASLCLFPRTR